jgi:LPXTG-motif cell wall-anchored protein
LSDNLKGILFAILTALLWGILAIALKIAVQQVDPFTIVWFRFTLAFSVLAMVVQFRRPRFFSIFRKPPIALIIAAIFLGVNYLGFLQGINYTTPGNAQVVMQIGPIMLAVVGILVYRERLTIQQMTGFAVAGIGLFFFYREQINNLIGNRAIYNQGMLWILLGASSWVVYATLQKRLVKSFAPQQLNLIIYLLPAIGYLPFVDFATFSHMSVGMWLLMIFLGMNTLIAYGALAEALKYTEANKISIIITCNPIITILVMLLLEALAINWIEPENFNPWAVVSGLLVITGAVLVVAKKKKKIPEKA